MKLRTKTPLFEGYTCGKCGGTGIYSTYHGACFSCHGNGFKLTKRGSAAQYFLNSIRRQPAERFVAGDLILVEGFSAGGYSQPTYWATVKSVEGSTIVTESPKYGGCTMIGGTYRKGFTGEEKRAQQALALAYQENLTKQGKPVRGSHIDLGL